MTRRLSRLDLASLGVVLLALVVGVVIWPRLPEQVAIHFSASGTPGNYVPRTVAVGAMPAVMVATGGFLKAVARIDAPASERAYDAIVCSTLLLFLIVHLFILGWALGYRLPFVVIPAVVVVWTVFVVGSALASEGLFS